MCLEEVLPKPVAGSEGYRCLQARVMSLVNDAVATMAAGRYTDPDTVLGVILGTGVNGAYVEQPQNVQNAGRQLADDTHVIIDCEWGDFVTPALPMTDADKDLDAASGNPGCQHYEKMTAGNGPCCSALSRLIVSKPCVRGKIAGKIGSLEGVKGACMLMPSDLHTCLPCSCH